MKLIIAEKPSLGKNIASAINAQRNGEYLANNEYVITWAYGHMYTEKDVKDYEPDLKKWQDIPLPYIPQKFELKVGLDKDKKPDKGKIKQLETIQKLINRPDIDTIIHCGDADREGQLIVDFILEQLGNKKPVKRLWLPEQTRETIINELAQLKDNNVYSNMHQEGLARHYVDWLIGTNLTTYATVNSGVLMKIGRVKIPIVKYIYDRDKEIKNFVPTKYYQSEGTLEKDNIKVLLKDKRNGNDKNKADEITKVWNSGKVKVEKVEKKEIEKIPGKLFSLSKLQSFLSKNHKLSFVISLKAIQNLYEMGYITYPRTNTEYLAENEKNKVEDLIEIYKEYPLIFKDTKKIFDSSKIESHSAIIPTKKKPDKLDETEKIVYETVKNRFIANFLNKKTTTEKVIIELKNDKDPESLFKLTGETVVNTGFLKYEPEEFKNLLPNFTEGEEFNVTFQTKEKTTTPKKKVTESELANFLKNPLKKAKSNEDKQDEEDQKDEAIDDAEYKELMDGIEIGTEATRTGIIEECKKLEYIEQKGSNYSILPKGEQLIDIADKLKINLYAEKNIEFSKILKKVFKGEMTTQNAINITKDELTKIINSGVKIEKINKDTLGEVIGICPKCGKNIFEYKTKNGKTFWSCEGYKNKTCNFALFEEMRFFKDKIRITKTKAKQLLGKSKRAIFEVKNKEGKEEEAYLKIKITEYNGKEYVNFEKDFSAKVKKK